MQLFLDACIIIYWIESREPYYSRLLAQLDKMQSHYPESELVVSRLSVLECCVQPLHEQNKKICDLYTDFFNQVDVEIIELDAKVIHAAACLRAAYTLKTPDAIQAACALSLTGPLKFVTNDQKFAVIENLDCVLI